MKGVILKSGRYHYERAWPKSVKPVAQTNKYRMALNLPQGASESEVMQAALVAQEDFEREVRTVLDGLLGPAGFDVAEDILAITVNRWPHGYAYEYMQLWDPE